MYLERPVWAWCWRSNPGTVCWAIHPKDGSRECAGPPFPRDDWPCIIFYSAGFSKLKNVTFLKSRVPLSIPAFQFHTVEVWYSRDTFRMETTNRSSMGPINPLYPSEGLIMIKTFVDDQALYHSYSKRGWSMVAESESFDEDQEIDYEDRILTLLLSFGMPFLIGFIAFGVIILAFSQWKLYWFKHIN